MGSALSSFKEQRKEKKELKRYLDHLFLVTGLIFLRKNIIYFGRKSSVHPAPSAV